MTLSLLDGTLAVYEPQTPSDSTEPDYQLSGTDTGMSARIDHSLGGIKDSASFTFDNVDGEYSYAFDPGTRVAFWYIPGQIAGDSATFGGSPFGSMPFGGLGAQRWMGVVTGLNLSNHGTERRTMTVEATDYVGGILGMREVYNSFQDRPVVGSTDAIAPTLISQLAPELDPQPLIDMPTLGTTDMFAEGEKLYTVINTLFARIDCLLWSDGIQVKAISMTDPTIKPEPAFTAEPKDHTPPDTRITSDSLINFLRVNGGTSDDIDERTLPEEGTPSGTAHITDTQRMTLKLSPEKTSFDRVEVWTQENPPQDGVVVRIQRGNADGTAPIDINDSNKDLVKKTLSQEFLSDNDYTTFLLAENYLPDHPWLILESDGPEGHDIALASGTDRMGVPAVITRYKYPVNVQAQNRNSQEEFLLRQDSISDESLTTFTAARDEGLAELRHMDMPGNNVVFSAESPQAHALRPGDAVELDYPKDRAEGTYIVTDVRDTYETTDIDTDLSVTALSAL